MRTTILTVTVAWVAGCMAPKEDEATGDTAQTETASTTSTASQDRCVTPTEADYLYPPYPDVPADCLSNFWDCPLEPGYASETPTTVCNITEGFDEEGTIQAQFWEAYNYSRAYFGSYGPVYVYMMGPTSEESNATIWELRAQRRAIVDACYPVEQQVDAFYDNEHGSEELAAANSGQGGYFSISGNSGCNPLMDMMVINPMVGEVRGIVMHEYHHVFQVAHMLTHDRDSDYGLSSWIMEGQATYSSAWFGEITGWGPPFVELMMGMKAYGGNTSPMGIDEFLSREGGFDLTDESYWERADVSPAVVYYQLGAWAWAYLVHSIDGDVDRALKTFIEDVPIMGRSASFELHFGRTMEEFFDEFAEFVEGDEEDWRAILEPS